MRDIEYTHRIKKDYRAVIRSPRHRDVPELLESVVDQLATDQTLAAKYRDPLLSDSFHGARECHLKPDLLLIYLKVEKTMLRLLRLGSHTQVFSQ